MSRLKSTRFVAVCGGVTEAVLVELKNQTVEARIARVRSSRVRKLISPNLLWNVRPMVLRLYPKRGEQIHRNLNANQNVFRVTD